jgi:hypothetical protein
MDLSVVPSTCFEIDIGPARLYFSILKEFRIPETYCGAGGTGRELPLISVTHGASADG